MNHHQNTLFRSANRNWFVGAVVLAADALLHAMVAFAAPSAVSLDGAWMVVSSERGGKPERPPSLKCLVIKGDEVRMEYSSARARFTTRRNVVPNEIDIVWKPEPKQDYVANLEYRGIFGLEDGLLTVCWNDSRAVRPTSFNTTNAGEVKYVLKQFHWDSETISGEWRVVSAQYDGKPLSTGAPEVCVFRGDMETVDIDFKGRGGTNKERAMLEQFDKPKTFSWSDVVTDSSGFPYFVITNGIYALENNSLKWAFSPRGEEAPTDFTTHTGDKRTVYVLERVKRGETKGRKKESIK